MVEFINGSSEPVNYTKVKVLWNPMNTLTNEAWKVNTQDQCNQIMGLS